MSLCRSLAASKFREGVLGEIASPASRSTCNCKCLRAASAVGLAPGLERRKEGFWPAGPNSQTGHFGAPCRSRRQVRPPTPSVCSTQAMMGGSHRGCRREIWHGGKGEGDLIRACSKRFSAGSRGESILEALDLLSPLSLLAFQDCLASAIESTEVTGVVQLEARSAINRSL